MNIDFNMITTIISAILGLIFILLGYVKMREKKGQAVYITLFVIGIVAVAFNVVKFILI
ncbi:hypothetical protein NNC19_16370 [Clostridium sp. SHJSY1]|uniref:hypothetical protein n=1 Tax=Clostridium sp. SHJSY1 TaxID=2942483 RepID=UPI0028754342|nr:hypothetical protein [Clostridium sp. SHJSY1]MDS0527266.1 hypothetical protein [Clostridium sp. SHJSY1]